jgi:nitrilase
VRHEETILYAEVDPQQVHGPRWQLDVAGHYARPDIFTLTVDRNPRPLVRTVLEGKDVEDAEAR